MHISRRVRTGTIAMLLAGTAAGVSAQTAGSTPPQTIPGLDNFNLPPSRPTPTPAPTSEPVPTQTPAVTPVPAPVATRTPRVVPTPAARATPRAETTPTPGPRATPNPTPTPTAAPTPAPAATPSPAPVVPTAPAVEPTPAATPTTPAAVTGDSAATQDGWSGWAIGAGLALLAGLAIAWWYRRARTGRSVTGSEAPNVTRPSQTPQPVTPPPPPSPAPAPAEPIPFAADRARLSVTLHPRRAGLNLLSATVEGELLVRNDGAAAATGIRIGATLIGATAGPEGDVAALFAQPVVRPITPPFALGPGEERRVRLVVALPRADIRSLAAGGRAMFVPVVAVNALYQAGRGEGQAAQAFAVGVERVDSAKLAPLWLDQPPRMYDGLGIRPYVVAIAR
ncbi:hypothetical protein FHT00_001940 [Sphingomonas insulae]|uniref:LPXTG-motif cell wall anchor domain-containing protein n=1 Tax=Sphingomonas insulae TaxID=424800 RepID=A0ABN1HWP9_9SPHN|nr:hypothetical protein [Sphingomonas insulae]NIJ29993.1 hypothetical protein [Sphingomonas insulae]